MPPNKENSWTIFCSLNPLFHINLCSLTVDNFLQCFEWSVEIGEAEQDTVISPSSL